MKGIRITIENGSIGDNLIVISGNFLLWWAEKIYMDDELEEIQKDIFKKAYRAIYG